MEQQPLLNKLEWSMIIMIILVFVWAITFTSMHPQTTGSFSKKHNRHSSIKPHQFACKAPDTISWNFTGEMIISEDNC